jgi:hypothetical protein
MTAILTAPAATSTRPAVARAGIAAALAAGATVTALAAAARAAGVSLDLDGKPIPLLGFAQVTVLLSLVGVVLAAVLARRAARPRRSFVRVTGLLTAASLVPPFLVPAAAGTVALLVALHLVAAAVVIPTLAARLR